jgi:hypothetical protein
MSARWFLLSAALVACTSSSTGVSQADIVYDGACTKQACADLTRPDTDCTETAPLFKCSPTSAGACAFTYTCPSKDDPGAATSFSPCSDEECGTKPTTAAEAGCATGAELTGSTCGRLNNQKVCAWQNGCVVVGAPIAIDASKVGPVCGAETDAPCATGAECVTIPLETGVRGAHCIADPCGLLGCSDESCIILDSFPGQVECTR